MDENPRLSITNFCRDRLTAAFRLMGCDDSANEVKVKKVLGKLHDELKKEY